MVEVVFTALFVAVILQSSKSERVRGTALLAIPLALVAIHVAAIPISGASVNPARSLGPALIGTEMGDIWIYLIAPPIGAIIGWIAHKIVVEGDTNLRDDFDAAAAGRRARPTGRPRRPADRELASSGRGARGGGRPGRSVLEHGLDPLHLTSDVVPFRRGAGGAVRPRHRRGGCERGDERVLVLRVDEHARLGGTNSGGPPTRVATTDLPHAIPSSVASPNGSTRLGWQTTSAA